jgi:hypothetical protein
MSPATPGQPATVVVYSPQAYVTTTSYAGSVIATSTMSPATPGQPATVVVYSPQAYVTTTSYAGSVIATSTVSPATPGQPVTVVVYSPQAYVTTTSYYGGSVIATSTIPPATPGQPATVVVYNPQVYVTTTSYAGSVIATSTVSPATPGQPATVVVYSPQAYTTTTSYYTGSSTSVSTVAPASLGQPATVIVYNPQVYTTVTSLYTGATTTTVTQSQAIPAGTVTVVVQVPMQYTTITTIGSGSVTTTVTQFIPTSPGQIGTVAVQLPHLNTVTTTVTGTAFTSTSTTTVAGVPSQIAVVGVPIPPFHIYVTDFSQNLIGYLTVNNGTVAIANTAHNANFTGYTGSSLFYLDPATNQLALSPSSGISAQPLYSIQQIANGPFLFDTNRVGNQPISAGLYADGTMSLANTVSGFTYATSCNGILYLSQVTGAGCIQVILNPTYNEISLTTTTVTSGSVSTARTVVPDGYTVTQGGTVTAVVPLPSCTATGIAYTAYTNPYPLPFADSVYDPFYIRFNSSYYNGLPASSALYSGVTNNINFGITTVTGTGIVYGTTRNTNQTAILYQGFFSPPTTGTYTLRFTNSDDITYLWMGATVTSSTWSELNYLSRGTYFNPPRNPVSQNFIAGQLYPIVILWGSGEGNSGIQLSITTPAGTVVTDTTGYFLQPICGNSGLPTATNQPTTTVSCAATGIQYINRPAPTASGAFNPNNYSPPTATPYSYYNFRGFTDNLSFSAASPGTSAIVYGQGPYDLTQSGTFLRGYFVPNATGSYTFSLNQPDDVGYMWIGPTAISGWNTTNAVIRGVTVASASGLYTTTLTAGVLTPLRLAFGNAGGAMSYSLHVLDPTGVTKTDSFGWFVQPWCGGVAQYSNWG